VIRVDEVLVRKRLRVWPRRWVGNVMCCLRSVESRRVWKEEVVREEGSSRWTLKSPATRRSEGNELSWSRRDVKSVMKEGNEMEGGR
jgi:hypothetical protein